MKTVVGISFGRVRIRAPLFAAAAVAALLLAGCARKEAPQPPAENTAPGAGAESTATATGTATNLATTEAAPATATSAPPPTTKTPPPPAPKRAQGLMSGASTPAARATPPAEAPPARATGEASPAPAAPAEAPPAEAPPASGASKVDDPGGPVAVASRNSAATRIGPEKCRICHKIQFASWAESGHAKRNPPLDCESCHGPGSEYRTLATMKDPGKAKAAGLVVPDAKFCATCHERDWKSDMLAKAHAHKAKPAE